MSRLTLVFDITAKVPQELIDIVARVFVGALQDREPSTMHMVRADLEHLGDVDSSPVSLLQRG